MGRHHDRKYGLAPVATSRRNGRVHQRMLQRRLAKQSVPAPFAIGLSRFGMAAPLGIIGLVGAGVLGYTLLNKRSIGGFSTWRRWLPFKSSMLPIATASTVSPLSTGTSVTSPVKVSKWRRWMPFKSSVLPVTTGASVATPMTGFSTGAPIVHNRKVPLKERALSKVTGRPVVTNYH